MAIIVIIVEDEKEIQNALYRALNGKFAEVSSILRADRAQEGLDHLTNVDSGSRWFVVSDMDMPPQEGDTVYDGLALLREVKKRLEERVCTVLLSGNTPPRVLPPWVDHALQKGAFEWEEQLIALLGAFVRPSKA